MRIEKYYSCNVYLNTTPIFHTHSHLSALVRKRDANKRHSGQALAPFQNFLFVTIQM